MSSQISINIRIGKHRDSSEQVVSNISIKAHTSKHQISQFHEDMKSQLKRNHTSLITIQTPKYLQTDKIPYFGKWIKLNQDIKLMTCQIDDKHLDSKFYFLDPKNPNNQDMTFIKKLDKVFSQLNTTHKQFNIEGLFYGIKQNIKKLKSQQKPLTPWSILLDNCHLSGYLQITQQFWQVFLKCINKISSKFADSPMMAVASLMQRFSIDLTLDSVNELEDDIKNHFIGQIDEQLFEMGKSENDRISIYISFRQLGYLSIIIPLQLLAVLSPLSTL